jgi:hypothetical protein
LAFGFQFPARMTVLPLAPGRLALVSPVPIDEQIAAQIRALGEVVYLIAPSLLHHLYLPDAMRRYPSARVIAPRALSNKRPDLRIDLALEEVLPAELTSAVEVRQVEGAPTLDEFVFFHRASRTLIVTDLVFNIVRPRGAFAHLVLFLMGVYKRMASSRALRVMVKDRVRCAASIEEILALPFDTVVMAHGEIVRENARERLGEALGWILGERRRLVAPV